MIYPKKEVRLIAYFADGRYSKNGVMLTIKGYGKGSSLSAAMHRAFKDVLKDPQIFHKCPDYIYFSAGTDGYEPFDIWDTVSRQAKALQRVGQATD